MMWLLGRLQPDYKSIAEFRRMHSSAVTEAGAESVRLARTAGLVRGETALASARASSHSLLELPSVS